MNLAILTHRAANSPEFQSGFPADWPYQAPVDIGERTEVPPHLKGWVVVSKADLEKYIAETEPAVAAWSAKQANEEKLSSDYLTLQSKRTEIDDALAQLTTLRDYPDDMTTRQLTVAARLIARVLVWLIQQARELFER